MNHKINNKMLWLYVSLRVLNKMQLNNKRLKKFKNLNRLNNLRNVKQIIKINKRKIKIKIINI